MRKYAITSLIGLSLFLAACGSDSPDEKSPDTRQETIYETGEFSIIVPPDWEVVRPGAFESGTPPSTLVTIRNNIRSEIFTANVNINTFTLGEKMKFQTYVKESLKQAEKGLRDFTKIEEEKVEEGTLHRVRFQGRAGTSDPLVRFYQLYTIKDDKGYIVTGGHLQNEDEGVIKMLEEVVESFALK